MTISSLAILSRTESGTDDLLYIKDFNSNNELDDIDAVLFQNIITENDGMTSIFTKPRSILYNNNTPHDCSIYHQSLLQSALEKFNNDIKFENHQRTTFQQPFRGADYMWVGFICLIDGFRFYGYITNTNVKIIVGVEDDFLPEQSEMQIMRDGEVKKTLVS